MKVADTSASTLALDVSSGSQGSTGTALFRVQADGVVTVPGTLDMGVVTASNNLTIPGNNYASFTADCPSGYYVLGGGGGHRDFNSAQSDITVNYSGPDPAAPTTRWLLRLTNNSGSSRATVVYCNCARLK